MMLHLTGVHLCIRIFNFKIAHETAVIVGLAHAMTFLAEGPRPVSVHAISCLKAATDFFTRDQISVGLFPATVHAISLFVPFREWLQNHSILRLGRLNQIEKILSRVVHACA